MTTLKENKLNNYTIEDFLKLKPIIMEYCRNLSKGRFDSKDIYQDVYLFVHDTYFNTPKEPIEENKFIQIMKNCTYWAFYRRLSPLYKRNLVNNRLTYFDESPITYATYEKAHYGYMSTFDDIRKHPDYDLYTYGLDDKAKQALDLMVKGYKMNQVAKIVGRSNTTLRSVLNRVTKNANIANNYFIGKSTAVAESTVKEDYFFLRRKVEHFGKVFTIKDERKIKLYSLYLKGYSHDKIGEILGTTRNQVCQEVFRINKKIKSLCQE